LDQGFKRDDPSLVYCQTSCGKSLHASCFQTMRSFNIREGKPILCVYCRQPWL
jgi:hypothetical protein